ncbi:hypothetical protein [Streptococcus australis]|nr:hypothetical protein [Streptococcus australis]
MKKKVFAIGVFFIIIIFGGIFYMTKFNISLGLEKKRRKNN